MEIKDLVSEFMKRNNISYTFYNKFVNGYSFCYSYKYQGIKKNMSFIVMEKDGEIVAETRFSIKNYRQFKVTTVDELEDVFQTFLEIAGKNEGIKLEEAC